MRRFLTLVCLLCVALPAGVSITGCYRNPQANYCNGLGYGLKDTDVASIFLSPMLAFIASSSFSASAASVFILASRAFILAPISGFIIPIAGFLAASSFFGAGALHFLRGFLGRFLRGLLRAQRGGGQQCAGQHHAQGLDRFHGHRVSGWNGFVGC